MVSAFTGVYPCAGGQLLRRVPKVCVNLTVRDRPGPRCRPRRSLVMQQELQLGRDEVSSTLPSDGQVTLSVNPVQELKDVVSRSGFVGMDDRSEQEQSRIRELLRQLESTPSARPETAVFSEFALAGKWQLLFSSSPSKASPDVKVQAVYQTFDAENKKMTSSCAWTFIAATEEDNVDAILSIESSYSFPNESALVKFEVLSHQLSVVPRLNSAGEKLTAKLPEDLQALVERLQGNIPIEIWDPSGLVDPATFMNPDFRVSCFLDDRIRGVRSVFKRCSEPVSGIEL